MAPRPDPSRAGLERLAHQAGDTGQLLDPDTRADMEARLGLELPDVRVHTDDAAAQSARAVSARAYTVGRDVFLGQGGLATGTREGARLLAHELVHVHQQEAGVAGGVDTGLGFALSRPDDRWEREATALADQAVARAPVSSRGPGEGLVAHTGSGGRTAPGPADAISGHSGANEGMPSPRRSGQPLVVQRDYDSDDFKAGYQDGKNAVDANVGPRTGDAATDYNEGYLKGRYEADKTSAQAIQDQQAKDQEEKVKNLDRNFNGWLLERNFQLAAEALNGFNHDDIMTRLKQHRDVIDALHQGALDNPRVGPRSQVAIMTQSGSGGGTASVAEVLEAGPTSGPFTSMSFGGQNQYTISYVLDEVHVGVGVSLAAAAGDARAAQLLAQAKSTWKTNIDAAWDNKFKVSNGTTTMAIRFNISLDGGPNKVTAHSGQWVWPKLNSANWFVPDTEQQPGQADAVAKAPVHEFGHLIGNKDEYDLSSDHYVSTVHQDPSKDPNAIPETDTTGKTRYTNKVSVMGTGTQILERHVQGIVDWLNANLKPNEPKFTFAS